MLCDQVLWAPFFSCVFFAVIKTLEVLMSKHLSRVKSQWQVPSSANVLHVQHVCCALSCECYIPHCCVQQLSCTAVLWYSECLLLLRIDCCFRTYLPASCCSGNNYQLCFVWQGTPSLIIPTIKAKLIKTLLANYAIWPLAHIINFKFIPSSQRILYINCVQVCLPACPAFVHLLNTVCIMHRTGTAYKYVGWGGMCRPHVASADSKLFSPTMHRDLSAGCLECVPVQYVKQSLTCLSLEL